MPPNNRPWHRSGTIGAACAAIPFGAFAVIIACEAEHRGETIMTGKKDGLSKRAQLKGGQPEDQRSRINRRTVLAGASALGAFSIVPRSALAQRQADTTAASLPARGEFVVRGAHVLSMDPQIGDLASGDVHVRDGTIVAVAASVNAPGAEVIDGRDMLCMPGFVETHWHLWTSCLRPVIRGDDAKLSYFPVTSRLGPHFTAEDTYRSVKHGLSEAIHAGVTTVHNWAHNIQSPEHADAELRAMRDMGIRGRFSYGTPQSGSNEKPMDAADLARVQKEWMPGHPLLSLGISSRNVGKDPNPMRGQLSPDMARRDWGAARDLKVPITLHTSGPSPVNLLDSLDLLGPDVQLVHPLLTTAEERVKLREKGTSYSMSPVGEARRPASAGVIQLAELIESGCKISMSIDHTTTYSCDCFGCMRMLYTLHRHRVGDRVPLTSKRLVQLATMDGAHDMGVADKVGSLTPGKRADLILIRTTDPNMSPMGDPYEALVSLAAPSNIDTVVIDGRLMKRKGAFTFFDQQQVARDSAQSEQALRARAKWP
jgi:5-methylthioadenosine/S-adenosylhomocysteine deaminase